MRAIYRGKRASRSPSSALTVGAMAIDHLIGTDDEPGDRPGLADPPAFLIQCGPPLRSPSAGASLRRLVVRRAAQADPDSAATRPLCSLLAVPLLALLFLSLPFPLAGAGIALGLLGREGTRRRIATAAVAIGALQVALGAGAYVVALIV